jgi:hypothetical protein
MRETQAVFLDDAGCTRSAHTPVLGITLGSLKNHLIGQSKAKAQVVRLDREGLVRDLALTLRFEELFEVVAYSCNRHTAGNFARLMPTHPVRNYYQAQVFVNPDGVFIIVAYLALIGKANSLDGELRHIFPQAALSRTKII